jgi:uroporphyrinogen-III synthase
MSMPLRGKTVALAEGRQLEELAALLQDEGAAVLRCPMLEILDAPDAQAVQAWLGGLIAGECGLLVLMTGEAIRRLAGFAESSGRRAEFVAALERTPSLARGPKPVKALRDLGVTATPRAAAAPTTEGVITTLRDEPLSGVTVGLTLFGQANPTLEGFLAGKGAVVRPVLSYVFAPAADDDRVADLIGKLAGGAVDAIVFTSSPQVDRLYDVAAKRGLDAALRQGLERARVAAVGPIVAESLRTRGARVDVCPEQGWVMKNLVRRLARDLGGSSG